MLQDINVVSLKKFFDLYYPIKNSMNIGEDMHSTLKVVMVDHDAINCLETFE